MARNPGRHVYEDYEPPSDLVSEDVWDTVLIYLPEFTKEQLTVQLTPFRVLKVSGERPIGDNKWRRFLLEISIPSNCDANGIISKFEEGILYIRQPKVITPPAATTKTELTQGANQVVVHRGVFTELRKPENLKRVIISGILVLSIGFYITVEFEGSILYIRQPKLINPASKGSGLLKELRKPK